MHYFIYWRKNQSILGQCEQTIGNKFISYLFIKTNTHTLYHNKTNLISSSFIFAKSYYISTNF